MSTATPIFDESLIANFDPAAFTDAQPFPWFNFSALLMPDAFAALHREYPTLEKFERHQNVERAHHQRPHNRYYLAYESSIYKDWERKEDEGVIHYDELAPTWQAFMDALETNETYRGFVGGLLGLADFQTRYAWHVGVNGSEVSPHRDADAKIGTHIFYFNTHEDWDPAWGGSTLALSGKKVAALNPEFEDFEGEQSGEIVDNRSFLFKNTPAAWHGVRPLTSPEGKYRRLFNVICEAKPEKAPRRSLFGKLSR